MTYEIPQKNPQVFLCLYVSKSDKFNWNCFNMYADAPIYIMLLSKVLYSKDDKNYEIYLASG